MKLKHLAFDVDGDPEFLEGLPCGSLLNPFAGLDAPTWHNEVVDIVPVAFYERELAICYDESPGASRRAT